MVPLQHPLDFHELVQDFVENEDNAMLGSLNVPISTDCTSQCAGWPGTTLHQKGALTMTSEAFNLRTVDDRKDWFK